MQLLPSCQLWELPPWVPRGTLSQRRNSSRHPGKGRALFSVRQENGLWEHRLEGVLLPTPSALSGPCGDRVGGLVIEGSWHGRWEQRGVYQPVQNIFTIFISSLSVAGCSASAIWLLDAFGP